MDGPGRVLSVNVGKARTLVYQSRSERTAIVKEPALLPVPTRGDRLEGDDQVDRKHHGGPDQAVYAYAREDYQHFEAELGRALVAGSFGENLTLAGVDVTGARIGERWRVGSAVLEVTSPRLPCATLGRRMGDMGFVRRFAGAGRFGAYLRIVEEGEIAAGDAVEIEPAAAGALTIGEDGRRRLAKKAG